MLTKCMKQSRAKGFTLTEVVLAIGVVAVLIVVFMAMFIPARRTVQSALTIREADRIVHALTAWRTPQFRACRVQRQKVFLLQICFRF